MPPEYLVTLAVALIALIGTVFGAVLQYRAAVDNRRSKDAEAARKEAEEATKKLEEAERTKDRQELQRQIEELTSEVQRLGDRFDKLKIATESRLNDHDDSIKKVVEVLSHDARVYSGIMRMHAQTESRMQALMDVQTYNMKFANETATSLRIIGELVSHALGSTPEDAERLRDTLDASSTTHKNFVDNILNAQQHFFKDTAPKSDSVIEPDKFTDKLHDIVDN